MKNKYIIILLTFITSNIYAMNQFDEVIAEESDNIVYRNSIDFDTRTTQVWRDSAWHNKWQWLKSYDANGYLTESEFSQFIDDEWMLRGNVSITNNDNGFPISKIKQIYIDDSFQNRSLNEYTYSDSGNLIQKTGYKWYDNSWNNRSQTDLQYEGDLCVNGIYYRWADSLWANRYLKEITYNDNGLKDVKVGYKWSDTGWSEWHKTEYSFDDNGDLSQKVLSKWTDSGWITKARITISRDDLLDPVEILLERLDSADVWNNVFLRENTFFEGGMIMESISSKWYDDGWHLKKRNEYSYVNGPGRFSLNIIPPTSLPDQIKLDQNYPNPFNPITIISYEIPRGEFVELNIFNLRGNKITTLVNEFQNPGIKSYQWNGTNDNGNSVSAGVYIYTIEAGNYLKSKKMILLK